MDDIKPPENANTTTKKHKEKTLLDRLRERATQKQPARGSAMNQALFLANLDEIEQAIALGWNSKMIWEELYESRKFLGGYECFRRYVRRHLPRKEILIPANQSPPEKPFVTPSHPANTSGDRFIFNPDASNDELI